MREKVKVKEEEKNKSLSRSYQGNIGTDTVAQQQNLNKKALLFSLCAKSIIDIIYI